MKLALRLPPDSQKPTLGDLVSSSLPPPKPMSTLLTTELKKPNGSELTLPQWFFSRDIKKQLVEVQICLVLQWEQNRDTAALVFLRNITHFNSNLNDTIHFLSLISASSWIPSLWPYSLQHHPSAEGRAQRVPLPTRSVTCWLIYSVTILQRVVGLPRMLDKDVPCKKWEGCYGISPGH